MLRALVYLTVSKRTFDVIFGGALYECKRNGDCMFLLLFNINSTEGHYM